MSVWKTGVFLWFFLTNHGYLTLHLTHILISLIGTTSIPTFGSSGSPTGSGWLWSATCVLCDLQGKLRHASFLFYSGRKPSPKHRSVFHCFTSSESKLTSRICTKKSWCKGANAWGWEATRICDPAAWRARRSMGSCEPLISKASKASKATKSWWKGQDKTCLEEPWIESCTGYDLLQQSREPHLQRHSKYHHRVVVPSSTLGMLASINSSLAPRKQAANIAPTSTVIHNPGLAVV